VTPLITDLVISTNVCKRKFASEGRKKSGIRLRENDCAVDLEAAIPNELGICIPGSGEQDARRRTPVTLEWLVRMVAEGEPALQDADRKGEQREFSLGKSRVQSID
jgi:hypothetical protein